jgi:hypothetical protein
MKKYVLLSFTIFIVCCISLAFARTSQVATSLSESQDAKQIHVGPSVVFEKNAGQQMQGTAQEQVLPYVTRETAAIIKADPEAQNTSVSVAQNPQMVKVPSDKAVPPPDPNLILQGGDNIATATAIGALPYTDAGTTSGYINDYNVDCPYIGSTAPDVVYSYVPAVTMALDIEICTSLYDTKLYVFENDPTTVAACNDDACGSDGFKSQLNDVPIYSGNTYYIVIDGYGTENGSYTLNVVEGTFTNPPANDNCGDVTPQALVPGTPLVFTGDNTGATMDCGLAGYAEVWMAFTITEQMNVTIDACGTVPAQNWVGTWLMGDCPCSWYIAANTWNWTDCGDGNWRLYYNTLPAGTYYYPFIADPGYNPTGPYTVTINGTVFVPPTPDFTITGPGTYYGNTCGALSDCPGMPSEDHIYEVVVSTAGSWTFSLCNTPVVWDSYLQLGTTVCGSEIAVNDDGCGNVLSTVTAGLAVGTYYLTVEGFGGSCGDYQLDVTYATPPPNDNCGDVTPQALVPGTPLTFTGDNTGATTDCALLGPYGDAWHAFTTTEELNVVVDYCGTTPAFGNYYWVVVPDCPCSSYILRSWYDWTSCPDGNITFGFDHLPAGTYYIPVLTDIGSVGPYTVNVNASTPPPAPPNDNCVDVTPVALVPGTPLVFTGTNEGSTIDCPSLGTPEVWHNITTTECMDITIDYCGTAGPWGNVYIVMTEGCCGALVFANDWDNFTCSDGNFTLRWIGVPAGTYGIPIIYDPANGSLGPYTINVNGAACPPPPPNDDCVNATPVGEVVDLAFDTQRASFDGAGACMTSNNIWYLYSPSVSAPATVSLCGSSYDTKLAVYDGPLCPEIGTPPTPSPLQGGETFGDAVPVGALPAAWTGTTAGYINDGGGSCVGTGAPDVFYSLTVPATQSVNVELCGSSYDTGLILWDDTFTQIGCNDDYCGVQSAIYGTLMESGRTYYIQVDGYGSNSGDYVMTVTGASYVMIECNDDFCGLQSQITFDAILGNQYLIEVGGFSSNSGQGILNISVPAAHDVAVDALISPRMGGLLDGVTPVDVTVNVSNPGMNAETFDVQGSDDHGYSSTYTGLTLNPGEFTTITLPNQYTPTETCEDYAFTVQAILATDQNPGNNAISAVLRVARTPDQSFVYDDDILENAWYFFAQDNLIAMQYTADADKELVYLSARTYVDELGFQWPDATADPFYLYLFLDLDLDGIPDLDPTATAMVLPTGISPSVAYGVLDCGVQITTGQNFWVAFGNIDDSPDHGSEGIAQDLTSDYLAMKWYRLAGVWTQGQQYEGDEMLRAYAVTGGPEGCVYIPGNVNGVPPANGIDVTYGVAYFKGGALPPNTCPMCPQPHPFYAALDVNGSCTTNGIDITYFVAYLKGGAALLWCPTCPPVPPLAPVPEIPTLVPTTEKVNIGQQ